MTEPEQPTICTRSTGGSDRIGAACPDCGHTNLVHPQAYANPSLTACVICELLAARER